MNKVISKDGTIIAYDKIGSGQAVILVDGALCYRASGPSGPLAEQLADQFTVFTYDRRGRGNSSDTPSYSVEREIEDIEALIKEAAGDVFLYGISSGAALALEAVNNGLPVKKLALYEAPFITDGSRKPVSGSYLEELNSFLDSNRRSAAVKHFMKNAVGLPAIVVTLMPLMPAWSKLKGVAHTLPYDSIILGDTVSGKPLPADRWSSVSIPVIVLSGGKSQKWIQNSSNQLARILSDARHETLEKQSHTVKPEVLAPVLKEFFLSSESGK